MACLTKHMTGGVEAGIKGGIHWTHLLWVHNYQEEEWGLLLIGAQNEFNEENRTAMLLDVSHEWSSSAHFTFNCYCHWETVMVRNLEGSGHFLYRKEDVTQGYPLDMIDYVIGVPPLIRELQDVHPCVTQTWYDDD